MVRTNLPRFINWMRRTLRLYGFIKEIFRKLPLLSQDSTAPTHILGTPPLLQRYNESNPVCSTTGHKDTPLIWMRRTLRLYGFIKEIFRKLPLLSQDSTAPTHILHFYRGTMNPTQSVRPQDTPLNGLRVLAHRPRRHPRKN